MKLTLEELERKAWIEGNTKLADFIYEISWLIESDNFYFDSPIYSLALEDFDES